MYSVKFKCQIITPMFMAGADGKTPELRPSEFKGMMRWWWRAIKAEDNLVNLKEKEAKIFGGTGDGQGRSKVRIKIVPGDLKEVKASNGRNLKIEYNFQWNFDNRVRMLKGKHAGIGYLFYSTTLRERERGFFKPKSTFEVILSSNDEEAFNQALASFWLAVYFGGFGTRSRRGGGNVAILEVSDNSLELNFLPEKNNSEDLARWLIINFQKASKLINGTEKPQKFAVSYSNLSFSRFIISKKSFNFWIDALNDIGIKFMNFRKEHKSEIFDTAVFGLPILHRSSKIRIIGGNIDKNGKIFNKVERRSSPLWIKIIKAGKNFYWLVLRLSGEFLEEGKVLLQVPPRGKSSQKPDYRLIDEFWSELKTSGNEYILSYPQTLAKTIEKIKKEINPRKIILFGSRARVDAYLKSDIDIAVDADRIGTLSMPHIDIINLRKINQDLLEKIIREGVMIYERKS